MEEIEWDIQRQEQVSEQIHRLQNLAIEKQTLTEELYALRNLFAVLIARAGGSIEIRQEEVNSLGIHTMEVNVSEDQSIVRFRISPIDILPAGFKD